MLRLSRNDSPATRLNAPPMIRFLRDTLQHKPPAPRPASLALRKGGVSEAPSQNDAPPQTVGPRGTAANG
jgi:hypothetical protein